jgi:hypothetical protein
MPRSRKADASPLVAVAVLFALLVALVGAPDRAVAAGTDFPPVVTNGVVSPTGLPNTGGTITVTVDAVDDVGLATVWIEAMGNDGSYASVEMVPSLVDTSYSATLSIAANPSDQPVSHTIAVHAWDGNSGETIAWLGEVQVDATPQFDELPIVSDPSVDPRELPAAGGTVTIQATATDTRGISEVLAVVASPGGGSTVVYLEAISSSRFEVTFTAPANTGAAPLEHAIEIFAYDDIGQQASVDAGIVTVAAQPGRPGRRPAHCRLAPPCRRVR